MDDFSYIANADTAYIDQLYQNYLQNPGSVDPTWQRFFEGFEFSQRYQNGNGQATAAPAATQAADKEKAVYDLVQAYRMRGHLVSKTNPVRERKDRQANLDIAHFGLAEADLEETFSAGQELGLGSAKLKDIIAKLDQVYCQKMGFEYFYIREPEEYEWFRRKVEVDSQTIMPSLEEKKRIFEKLNEAVVFENFLHTKYIGQKRFSLEGGETSIPALDAIINKSAELGVEEVVLGMAHRGRLNVLANIMGKTYAHIFNEFEGNAKPDVTMGDGDVKYHLGYSSQVDCPNSNKVMLKLSPNPSHLDAVDPVVEGYARAKADSLYEKNFKRILPVLIHGDAALAGQGVVYEVAQMSKLEGFTTGGTIHFVINNQVGFTTDFDDARSSTYCTNVAKIVRAPVIHVNGDDPEAVVFASNIAAEYRAKFGKDIYIDMVCYRRHGHNEADEPKFTQPQLYNKIAKHPNPREIYKEILIKRGDVEAELAQQMDTDFRSLLQDRLSEVKQNPLPYSFQKLEREWQTLRRANYEDFDESPDTSISQELIEKVGQGLTHLPEDFKPLRQVEKLIKQRQETFFEKKQFNWAAAELLAYGSLLLEGKTVRMSGQDVKRGTFSHRHSILFDANNNQAYNSLNHLAEEQGEFMIYNSLLSEYGVLGFEYGYAMANPSALTIWEAQFGDFANGAQVAIDQFITSGESKWQRMNGLVMLLPHGYEGQGPEHSNARPERFLQLAAELNLVLCNLTTPANFFHMLRRQLKWEFRKPTVLMSPKSLLRHPKVVSPEEDFTENKFRELIEDAKVPENARKLLLCSGKVYFDLEEEREKQGLDDVALVRVEQLYPFPRKQLLEVCAKHPEAQILWVQEEPENMGAWFYILASFRKKGLPAIDVVARKPSASPATGFASVHQEEQAALVEQALND